MGFIAIRLMSNSGNEVGDVIPGNLVGQPRKARLKVAKSDLNDWCGSKAKGH